MTYAARIRAALALAGLAVLGGWWAATTWSGTTTVAAPPGLVQPGPVVTWGVRFADVAVRVASVAAVGCLLAALVASPWVRRRALQAARASLLVWLATVLAVVALGAAEAAALPLPEPDPRAWWNWLGSAGGAVLLLTLLAAAGLAARLPARPTRRNVAGGLLAVLAGALILALGTHASHGGEVLTGALVVHVVAALLWTGGLVGLLLLALRDPDVLVSAAPRFSTLALGCYLSLAASGVLALTATVPVAELRAGDPYVGVVIAKAVVLLALGVVGHQHRRRTLPHLAAGRPHAFARLAAGEVVVLGAGLGLATSLARTRPPVAPGATGTPAHGHTPDIVELGWSAVVTQARPNAVVLVVVAVVLAGYLSLARTRRLDGAPWPAARTASLVCALGLVVLLTCSGLTVVAHSQPAVLLTQLLTMTLLVPALLLGGRPLRLLRVAMPATLSRWLERPATGAAAVCGLLVTVQYTPLVSLVVASAWWHLLLLLVGTGCGIALWWPTLVPPSGRTWTSPLERAGWLVTVAVALGVMALRLQRGGDLLTSDWFLELRLVGVDPADDRASAATAAATAALSLILAAAAVAAAQYGSANRHGGQRRASTVPRSSSVPIEP